jgi:GTP-binding protein
VVQVGDWPHEQSFTVADLPGLIEGAHLGAGLGIQFLKHIERTSVVVHLVDVSDASGRPDPVEDFKTITAELKSFDPALALKPTLVVAAKIDVANPDKLKKLKAMAKRKKLPFYEISAVTGEGIEPLKYGIAEIVAVHRPIAVKSASEGDGISAPPKRKRAYPPPPSSAKGRG